MLDLNQAFDFNKIVLQTAVGRHIVFISVPPRGRND